MELLQQVVLPGQGLDHKVGIHVSLRPGAPVGNVGFPCIGPGADHHKESPHVLAQNLGHLGDTECRTAFYAGLGQPQSHQQQLVVEHFGLFPLQAEGLANGRQALFLEAYMRVYVALKGVCWGFPGHSQLEKLRLIHSKP